MDLQKFGFLSVFINIILSFAVGGNSLPSGGGRSFVRMKGRIK